MLTGLHQPLLGGSGAVISEVISPLIWVISTVALFITLLITTHEPPSMYPVNLYHPAYSKQPLRACESNLAGQVLLAWTVIFLSFGWYVI